MKNYQKIIYNMVLINVFFLAMTAGVPFIYLMQHHTKIGKPLLISEVIFLSYGVYLFAKKK